MFLSDCIKTVTVQEQDRYIKEEYSMPSILVRLYSIDFYLLQISTGTIHKVKCTEGITLANHQYSCLASTEARQAIPTTLPCSLTLVSHINHSDFILLL